jgi:hypothetical protein
VQGWWLIRGQIPFLLLYLSVVVKHEENVGGDAFYFYFFGSSFYIATVSTTCTAHFEK